MKLLPAVPHTEEDRECWWWSHNRVGFDVRKVHMLTYCVADRRDAMLILFQMTLRDKLTPRGNYIRWMDLHPGGPDWRAECR